ncbi:MAG: PilZ domain-containing protein [Deltaproteobacteria bacterium]|nr:PilZ domain-containing protein [Deltaproteobacteria bacterium]
MRKERRKHLRLSLNFKVKLEMPRRELVLEGHTLNLSFAGAFIELDHIPLVLPNEYFNPVGAG